MRRWVWQSGGARWNSGRWSGVGRLCGGVAEREGASCGQSSVDMSDREAMDRAEACEESREDHTHTLQAKSLIGRRS